MGHRLDKNKFTYVTHGYVCRYFTYIRVLVFYDTKQSTTTLEGYRSITLLDYSRHFHASAYKSVVHFILSQHGL